MSPADFVYLSDNGTDEYINMLAEAVGAKVTDTKKFDFLKSRNPVVLRSILKNKIMNRCRETGRDFYYVDSGYLGNTVSPRNRFGNKLWHRIVKNGLQHTEIQKRPSDRFDRLGITWARKKLSGSKIIVAAPDDKPCRHYGIDLDTWINDTVSKLKQHTDREIVVRQRVKHKTVRMVHDPLSTVLVQDVHALVTFNSNAAVEAVIAGVPAFVLAPEHVAMPVASTDLSMIEDPVWPEQDLMHAWLCHLAYCQFHVKELIHKNIWNILNE
jgi:hypothetical protein